MAISAWHCVPLEIDKWAAITDRMRPSIPESNSPSIDVVGVLRSPIYVQWCELGAFANDGERLEIEVVRSGTGPGARVQILATCC